MISNQYDMYGDSEATSRGPGLSSWSPYPSPAYRRNRPSQSMADIYSQPDGRPQQMPQKMTADQIGGIKYQQPIPPNFDYIKGDLRGGPVATFNPNQWSGAPLQPWGGDGIQRTLGGPTAYDMDPNSRYLPRAAPDYQRPGSVQMGRPPATPGMPFSPDQFNAYLEKMKAQRMASGGYPNQAADSEIMAMYQQPYTGRPRPPMGGSGIAVGEPNPGMDPVSKPAYSTMGPGIAVGEPNPGGYQKPKIGPNTGGGQMDPPTMPPILPGTGGGGGSDPYVPEPGGGGGGGSQQHPASGYLNTGWNPFSAPGVRNPVSQSQAITAANYGSAPIIYQDPVPPLPTPAPVPGGGGGVPDASQSERPQYTMPGSNSLDNRRMQSYADSGYAPTPYRPGGFSTADAPPPGGYPYRGGYRDTSQLDQIMMNYPQAMPQAMPQQSYSPGYGNSYGGYGGGMGGAK